MRPYLRYHLGYSFKYLIVILGLLFVGNLLFYTGLSIAKTDEPLEVILVTSAQCHACQMVKENVIPRIKEKYKDKIKIKEIDFSDPEGFLEFLALQDRYDWRPEENKTPTVCVEGKFLIGSGDIDNYLEMYIDTALSVRGQRAISTAKAEPPDLISRFKLITPLGVIAAGLIDGINPCAFTVIIFFISFLTLHGYNSRMILAIGSSFILAVFITYILIGLGLFNFLFRLKEYWIFVKIIYIAGALLCFSLAGLALYDYLRFLRTHKTQELVLQLPQGLKDRIRRIIGFYYRKGKDGADKKSSILRLILSAFIVGIIVSLFEAVCTGQVYLPTVVFVLKTTPLKLKAFFFLILYNLMFIVPLWLILLFALWGITSEEFARFTQRHIGTIKLLMMVLFLCLGIFLIWQ